MTIKTMEKNLMQTGKKHQTVRVQSANRLYTGNVKNISGDTLDLQTKNGDQKFDMNQVDNYKIMK